MSGQRLYTYPEANALPENSPGIGGMVQAARRAYCGAWRKAPWAFIGIFPDTPISQQFTALNNKICPNPVSPEVDPTTPSWRAACPIRYRVFFEWAQPNNPNVPGPQTGDIIVLGPIQGGVYNSSVSGTIGWGILGATTPSRPTGYNGVVTISSDGSSRKGFYGKITGVVPIDDIPAGGCHLVPPPRQYDQPFLPGDDDFVGPPGPLSPTGGPGAPVGGPIVFPPSLPFALPVPIVFPIAPVIYAPVRVGPIDFNFDLGGVNFQLNGTVNVNVNLPGSGPVIGPGDGGKPPVYLPPGETADCVPCDLTGVIELIRDTRTQVLKGISDQTDILQPQEAPLQWTAPTAPQASGMAVLPLNAVFVRFEFIDNPTNRKSQWGGGGAPDVTFAGWAFFGGATQEGGERIPLDYNYGRIPVPPFATHVGWTCKDGRRAAVSVATFPAGSGNLKLGRNLLWRARV